MGSVRHLPREVKYPNGNKLRIYCLTVMTINTLLYHSAWYGLDSGNSNSTEICKKGSWVLLIIQSSIYWYIEHLDTT